MMRFTDLQISNFRGIREIEIAFEPDLTVVVGPNGAGKTSILDALAIALIELWKNNNPLPKGSEMNFPFPLESGQFVHEDADSARFCVKYEFGDRRSDEPSVGTIDVEIDGYAWPIVPSDHDGTLPKPGQGYSTVGNFIQVSSNEALPRLPRFIYYRQAGRFAIGEQRRSASSRANVFDPNAVQDRSLQTDLWAISDLETWWDQRDAQEARRVRDGERDYRDPQLEAIRRLIEKIDGTVHIYFDSTASPPGLHFVKLDGKRVHVSNLSGGEMSYIILLADLARRLQVFDPDRPLNEIPAIVLIDEVELNLHPGWQNEVVPTLADVFRGCQFIVTTHSPQVLSGVKAGNVRIIEEDVPGWSSKVTMPRSTRGRTSNYLLEGVLGARERLPLVRTLIDTFNAAIDRNDLVGAKDAFNKIEQEISDDVPTLLVLRKRLKRLQGDA